MTIKQTAGRDALGDFAPKFAQLNDDVLFGEVWSREGELSLRDRSVVTVVALMAQGLTDSSFQYHLMSAKNNGVTRAEIAEILTHAAFYAGWPKAWAAFRMAKEVWADERDDADEKAKHQNKMAFPIGAPNDAYARYFVGQDRTVDADSLAETLGQDLLVLHINQLIFQRGASAVQNKNFHFKFLHHFLKPPAREAGQRRIDTPIHLLYYYI